MQGWNRIERCLISMTGGISRYYVSVNPPRPFYPWWRRRRLI